MPPRPAKPCPQCRKPIQPDAAKCWFCGAVFDVTSCPACASPVKQGAATCWFCGGILPAGMPGAGLAASPADPQLAESIQTAPAAPPPTFPPTPATRECPHCGDEVPSTVSKCPECGTSLEVGRRPVIWEERPPVEPHRGGTLLTLAIFSLFCCGIILGPIVAIVASNDLTAMREQRKDPQGEGTTRAAQIIAIISAVLHGIVLWAKLSGARF
jgi:hypothetical protein